MGRAVAALEPGGRPVRAPFVSRGTRAPGETYRCPTRPLFCCLPRLRDVRDRDRVRHDSREVERIADSGSGRGGRPPCDGRSDLADRDGPVVGPDGTPGHLRAPGRKPVSLPRPETLLTGRPGPVLRREKVDGHTGGPRSEAWPWASATRAFACGTSIDPSRSTRRSSGCR